MGVICTWVDLMRLFVLTVSVIIREFTGAMDVAIRVQKKSGTKYQKINKYPPNR